MIEQREGKEIYREGKIEVRTHDRDPEAHNVWVGEDYFLFMRGCLEQLAVRTLPKEMHYAFTNYNPMIPHSLEKAEVSLDEFVAILKKARAKEYEDNEREYREFKKQLRSRIT